MKFELFENKERITKDTVETAPVSDRRMRATLDQISPALSSLLINEEGYARLVRVASLLPLEFSSFWGLECRLGQQEALADILFAVKKGGMGITFLAGTSPSSLDQPCHAWPSWRNLRALAQTWLDESHLLHRHVRNIWLEFDLAEASSPQDLDNAIRQPNIFFGTELSSTSLETLEVTREVMTLLGRSQPDPAILQWFMNTLPSGANLFQLGLMLTRVDDCGLRLCVDQVKPDDIRPWLAAILTKQDSELFSECIEELLPMIHHVAFIFNLTDEGVAATIGLECYRDGLQNDPEQWLPLFDFLTDRGLCLPEKVYGVCGYAGVTESPIADRLAGSMVYLNTIRKINHVKCTLTLGQITQAKIYLAVIRPRVPLDVPGMISEDRVNDHVW